MNPRPVITRDRLAEDLLPPTAPIFAPPKSLFAPAPLFAAQSVFAPTSPFGGGRKPPPEPPSVFAGESPFAPKGREGQGRKPRHLIHRKVVLIPPNRPRHRSQWVYPYDTVQRVYSEYLEASVDNDVLEVGNGLDFTDLAEMQAEADHRNGYCPYGDGGEWDYDGDEVPADCPGEHGHDAEWQGNRPLWSVEDDLIRECREEGVYDEGLEPSDFQVLAFERTRGGDSRLYGRYVVTEVVVHAGHPEGAPDYLTGWHEVVLAPCDEQWQIED